MKVKSVVKKVALVMAGVAAITAVGFGVKAIVDYTNEDLKTISPSFSIGNLGSDGKYVEDEGAMYTKEAFACYGLQIKPEFDSEVEYQIYYYDILDSYISCTDVLTESFCEEAPLNGAYARIVITPVDDEDGEIGILEKYTYANDINIKVYKEQNLEERFCVCGGRVIQLANNLSELVFEKDLFFSSDDFTWNEHASYSVTSTYLAVDRGSTITANFDSITGVVPHTYHVYEFSDLPSSESFLVRDDVNYSNAETSVTLQSKTKYVLISIYIDEGTWTDSLVAKLPSCFTIS